MDIRDPGPKTDLEHMECTIYLPFEMLEQIFSYLSVKDLVSCSKVSIKWREASNSDKLWRPICENLSWGEPVSLCDIELNFFNKRYQFCFPHLSDRLLPMSEWKLCYCQQNYLSFKWRIGLYVTHSFGESIKWLRTFAVALPEPERKFPFIPIVERVGEYYEFSIMYLDGELKKMCCLERNTADNISVVCVAGNTLTYVVDNRLKIASYQDDRFTVIGEHNLQPSANEMSVTTFEEMISCMEPNYFIHMNSDYLVAGHKSFYFYVWDRKTGDKISFVECPVPKSVMSTICLHGDRLYFAIKKNVYKAYEYSIVSRRLTRIKSLVFPILRLFTNDLYLITLLDKPGNRKGVYIYDRMSKRRLNRFTLSNCDKYETIVLLENNLLFCLDRAWIRVRYVPSCELKTEFEVSKSVSSLYLVHESLIVLNTLSEVQVWNWEKGVLFYTM